MPADFVYVPGELHISPGWTESFHESGAFKVPKPPNVSKAIIIRSKYLAWTIFQGSHLKSLPGLIKYLGRVLK